MSTETKPGEARDERSRQFSTQRWMLGIIALFLVLVGGRMVLGQRSHRAESLLLPADMLAARQELRLQPQDEELKQRIRLIDRDLRRRYFGHLDANAWGAWLLVIAAGLGLLAAHGLASAARSPFLPGSRTGAGTEPRVEQSRTRWGIAAIGALGAGAALVLVGSVNSRLPDTVTGMDDILKGAPQAAMERGPEIEEWLASWPMFRGPRGDGVASTTNAPLSWDSKTGQGIRWTAAVPWPGHSSPLVWGDRIFLTGGAADGRHVGCWEMEKGTLLWDRVVPAVEDHNQEQREVPETTGYAASTGATDGQRIYVIYATGQLAAFDFAGVLVWSKQFGPLDNPYGHASSLVLWQDLLLVQLDQGEAESGKSRLYALDANTGAVRWEQRRAVPSSWTTPLVDNQQGAPQVITLAEPWIITYDAASGTEIWRAKCLGPDLAVSPVTATNLLVAVSPGSEVVAFRLGGQGDVTKTHQAWTFDELVPDIVSPLSDGARVYLLTTPGDLLCLDAESGRSIWEHAFDLEFNASPVLVGNHIYLLSVSGLTVVVEAGPEFREVARAELEDEFHASPAVLDGGLVLRGKTSLYCLSGSNGSVLAREAR